MSSEGPPPFGVLNFLSLRSRGGVGAEGHPRAVEEQRAYEEDKKLPPGERAALAAQAREACAEAARAMAQCHAQDGSLASSGCDDEAMVRAPSTPVARRSPAAQAFFSCYREHRGFARVRIAGAPPPPPCSPGRASLPCAGVDWDISRYVPYKGE